MQGITVGFSRASMQAQAACAQHTGSEARGSTQVCSVMSYDGGGGGDSIPPSEYNSHCRSGCCSNRTS